MTEIADEELQGKYSAIEGDAVDSGNTTKVPQGRKKSLAKKVIHSSYLVPESLPHTEGTKEKRRRPSRSRPDGISNFEAGLQVTKIMLGTGILFMPEAFKKSGLIQGVIMSVAIAALTALAYEYLINASQYLCRARQVNSYSYGETTSITLQEWPLTRSYSYLGKGLISLLIITSTYTVAIIYMLMIATNIQQISKAFGKDVPLRIGLLLQLPLHVWTTSVRSMSRITPMTLVALIALWTGYLLTTYNIASELLAHGIRQPIVNFTSFAQLLEFFAIAVFSYVGIHAISAIENNMRHPRAFIGCPSVSCVSITFVGFVYTAYGVMGYLAFGPDTKGPITSQFHNSDVIGNLLKLSISTGLAFSMPIMLFAPFQIAEDYLSEKLTKKYWVWISRSWAQMLFIGIIPLIATDIQAVLQLISVPCALLQFVIPFLIDSFLFWDKRSIAKKVLSSVQNIVFVFIGLSFVAIGMYFGIRALIT